MEGTWDLQDIPPAHCPPRRPAPATHPAMLMLAESPSKDYFAQRMGRDPALSPTFPARHCTPPRLVPASSDASSYDSPMLTPSPLRHRPLFPTSFNPHVNDLFLQSPYKSPAPPLHPRPLYHSKPHPIVPDDDDDGSIFLSSPTSTPFFPPSSSQPLRTPVKQIHRMSSRSNLSFPRFSSPPLPDRSLPHPDPPSPATRIAVGIKRKSTPHITSTPVRPHNLAPLVISSTTMPLSSLTNYATLDRLAPLPAPKFVTATPQTRAETEAYLKTQTTTLTRLSIADTNISPEDVTSMDDDSGCDMADKEYDNGPASLTFPQLKGPNSNDLNQPHDRGCPDGHGKARPQVEEVAEAISPGGHVIKRRARRRPLSAELLESARQSPSPSKVRSSIHCSWSVLPDPSSMSHPFQTIANDTQALRFLPRPTCANERLPPTPLQIQDLHYPEGVLATSTPIPQSPCSCLEPA